MQKQIYDLLLRNNSCMTLILLHLSAIGIRAVPNEETPLVLPLFEQNSVAKTHGIIGNGSTDITTKLREAINEGRTAQSVPDYYYPRPKGIYLPAGTYIISDTIAWIGCAMTIQGQGVGKTVLKLSDNNPKFQNALAPRAVLSSPAGNYSFRQNIHDLTIDVGKGNPGAIALSWIANNNACLKNVTLISHDRTGAIGLDMSRYGPGPCMAKNLTITGFDYGIKIDNREYGVTFENLTMSNQKKVAIFNGGNMLHIINFYSLNTVPVLITENEWGNKKWSMSTIINATLKGGGSDTCAIINKDYLYVRNLKTTGYKSAIFSHGTLIAGQNHAEFVSDSIHALFKPSPAKSLGLPIKSTPEFHENDFSKWAQVPYKESDPYYISSSLLNFSNDTAATEIYTRMGGATLTDAEYSVPATVKQFIGYNCVVNSGANNLGLTFIVDQPSEDPLIIERFGYGVKIIHRCNRTVVIRHGNYTYTAEPGAGDVYFEDVTMKPVQFLKGQKVWARQFNTESPDIKIINNGADLWILGIKTEKRNTVIKTVNGGRTELLGGLIYPLAGFTSQEDTIPAFFVENSVFSAICGYSSYADNGMYKIFIKEIRGKEQKTYATSQLDGHALPLYVGFSEADIAANSMQPYGKSNYNSKLQHYSKSYYFDKRYQSSFSYTLTGRSLHPGFNSTTPKSLTIKPF